jgi:hypothetical protein
VLATLGDERHDEARHGDEDRMIPTKLSHPMTGLIPDVRIRLDLDAARGSLFRYLVELVSDVDAFLTRA